MQLAYDFLVEYPISSSSRLPEPFPRALCSESNVMEHGLRYLRSSPDVAHKVEFPEATPRSRILAMEDVSSWFKHLPCT